MAKKDTIIFATSNPNKVAEVTALLTNLNISILSLHDIGFKNEIPETSDTFEGNALQKALHIYKLYKSDVFAEDTGLEVYSLNMAPGVKTARFAGAERNDQNNMDLLLKKLKDQSNRKAQFRTVISLFYNDKKYFFTGIIKGTIAYNKSGDGGFGYDSIFIPEGYDRTFAKFSKEEKNKISHRGIAVRKLIDFLNNTISDI